MLRAALLVLATVLLAPYVLLALGFAILGRAVAAGSAWDFLDRLLVQVNWLLPWGLLAIASALIGLALLGIGRRTRRAAAIGVAGLGVASLATILTLPGTAPGVDALVFLAPAFVATACGAWIAHAEGRRAGD